MGRSMEHLTAHAAIPAPPKLMSVNSDAAQNQSLARCRVHVEPPHRY
jgi:hypothetical protein